MAEPIKGDAAGHCARPEVLRLLLDRSARTPLVRMGEATSTACEAEPAQNPNGDPA